MVANISVAAPTEASNVGGVAVSGLEMAQNSQRLTWSREEVDTKLKSLMTNIYNISLDAGTRWSTDDADLKDKVMPSLLTGANVAGFIKVADAMKVRFFVFLQRWHRRLTRDCSGSWRLVVGL